MASRANSRLILTSYAAWLDGESYAYATEYLELTTLKQAIKWLVDEGHLPKTALIRLPLEKPTGTDTHCYTPAEVAAIVGHCSEGSDLLWLARIVTALACTGLRISELAALRWADVDEHLETLRIVDERFRSRDGRKETRRTKTGRSRAFPIHSKLRRVLQSYFHLHDDESRRQMQRIRFLEDAGGAVGTGRKS